MSTGSDATKAVVGEDLRVLADPFEGSGPGSGAGERSPRDMPGEGESTDQRSAVVLYNNNAGSATVDPEEIGKRLEDLGFEARVFRTDSPAEIGPLLADSEGLVVVAGGDGTVREVVKRLLQKPRPLALLPFGTANNIARTLGLEGSWQQVVESLSEPRRVPLDVAVARGPWGSEIVLEGAGAGLFANILTAYRPKEGKNLLRALGAAANELGIDEPVRYRIELDGKELDGEYLLVEAMNMRAVGPRLSLAPAADPSDGLLDLVLVRADRRDALLTYVTALINGGLAELPSVEIVRGSRLRIHWRGSAFHVDSLPFCEEAREAKSKAYSAQLEIKPGALEVWLPKQA